MAFWSERAARNCAVTRDVKKLAEFGLVRLRQQNNPGHGIELMEGAPVAS
jgi:hypothetical protein